MKKENTKKSEVSTKEGINKFYAIIGVIVFVCIMLFGVFISVHKQRMLSLEIQKVNQTSKILENSSVGESKDISNNMTDRSYSDYQRAMDEIYATETAIDDWEGTNGLDKFGRRIALRWGTFYSHIARWSPVIIMCNLLLGVFIALVAWPLKFKNMINYGLFGICFGLNATILVLVIGGGIFNSYYLGF